MIEIRGIRKIAEKSHRRRFQACCRKAFYMSLEIKSSIFAKMALYKTASMEIASTKNRNTYTTNLRLNEKIHKNTKK